MGLETGTYPSDFVLTNPTSGDAKSQGDDHLRLIKTCVQNALPIGAANYPLTSGVLTSVSGTSVDFTSIPSWVKRITVIFNGVSTNGTSNPLIQIGDSGGIETTGYAGASSGAAQGSVSLAGNYTTGFGVFSASASVELDGVVVLTLLGGASWVAAGTLAYRLSQATITTCGSKTLTATLDRVRITTVNGTDTFDAGSVNILYE